MGNVKQFKSTEDDCVYYFDANINKYRKTCDIGSFNELPLSVRNQINEAKEEAVEIIRLPIN